VGRIRSIQSSYSFGLKYAGLGRLVREQRDELIGRVLRLERALCRAAWALQPEPWLEVELTMAQLKALFTLASTSDADEAAGLRVADLADRLGITPATASHLVDRLVERGLVDRRVDPRDRRQHRCRPTPDGYALVGRLHESGRWQARSLLEPLTSEELGIVQRAFEVLLHATERVGARAGPRDGQGVGRWV
jgi:MarR family transcriptional regulator, organic hydroperoxide resistance regulator